MKKLRDTCSLTLAAALLALACSDDPVDRYAPISRECDACLSGDTGGCTDAWDACREIAACEDLVACELNAGCYAEPSASSCAEDAGCTLGDDASAEAEAASVDFEACARTTCREACDYREP